MKISKLLIAFGAFTATLLAALAVTNGSAFAAARTWDGGGSDDNFSTAANWDTDTAPVNGDSIVLPVDVIFSACTDSNSPVTLNNDLDFSTTTIAGISLSGSQPSGCYSSLTIDGNDLKLSGDITPAADAYFNLLFSSNIAITQDISISAQISIAPSESHTFDISNHTLTVSRGLLNFNLKGDGVINISGIYSNMYLSQTPSPEFVGTINVGGTSASISGYSDGFQFGSGAIVNINSEGHMLVNVPETGTISTPITLSGTGYDLYGNVYPALYVNYYGSDGGRELTIDSLALGANSNFKATSSSADNRVKVTNFTDNGYTLSVLPGSQGKLILGGVEQTSEYETIELKEDNTGDYEYTVYNKKKVVVTSDWSTHPFTVFSGGILAGTGRVGAVTVNAGGILAPGLSPGTLTTGNITWVEGGKYEFEIGKDGADKIVANGTVTLGNGTLSVLRYQDYAPKAGDVYTLIENDGTDAVAGTFKDLPEGATFTTADGAVYKINYGGGDGNDVILTVVGAPKVPNTGFELLKNNPVVTLLTTTAAAGILVAIAKKRASIKA